MIHTQRIYESNKSLVGKRILVDRVWPRGIKKEAADLDDWMKDIAPSTELRKWFRHDPSKFNQFKEEYEKELMEKHDLIGILLTYATTDNLILLYGAKDKQYNQASVLKRFLEERLTK